MTFDAIVGELIQQLAILFLIIAIGVIANKAGYLDVGAQKTLRTLTLTIALPFKILSASKVAGNGAMRTHMLWVLAIAIFYFVFVILLSFLVAAIFKIKDKRRAVLVVAIPMANVAFVGIPIAQALFGEVGAFYVSLFNLVQTCFTWTFASAMLSGESKLNWKKALLNPNTIAAVAVIILVLINQTLPPIVQSVAESVGSITLAVPMLVFGAMLSEMKLMDIVRNPFCYIVSVVRLIIVPLLFAVVLGFLPIVEEMRITLLLCSAISVGIINGMLAQQYECESELMAQSIAHSTVLSLITIPLVLSVGTQIIQAVGSFIGK